MTCIQAITLNDDLFRKRNMKNRQNIDNRGNKKSDCLDTSALLNKMTYSRGITQRESVSDSITRNPLGCRGMMGISEYNPSLPPSPSLGDKTPKRSQNRKLRLQKKNRR